MTATPTPLVKVRKKTKFRNKDGTVPEWTGAANFLGIEPQLSRNGSALVGHDIYIITVPTPVDEHNTPDLRLVERQVELAHEVEDPRATHVLAGRRQLRSVAARHG